MQNVLKIESSKSSVVVLPTISPMALVAILRSTAMAVDLRIATNAIGEIVGKTTTEDLLDSIFSTFCIGK